MINRISKTWLAAVLLPLSGSAFVPTMHSRASFGPLAVETSTTPETSSESHWLDVLKFDGQEPSFDVLELAKKYTSEPAYKSFTLRDIPTDYYAEDYVFRGPIVGPINRKELVLSNNQFEIDIAYPDLNRESFGFTVDPENPFRVLYFERWKGTNTGDLKFPVKVKATGKRSISPIKAFSITFNPEGKVIYESVSPAIDRFDGNTKGKVAVFGLMETLGLPFENNVGKKRFIFLQKLGRFFNGPAQTYSRRKDLAKWWKSKAIGGQKNDI